MSLKFNRRVGKEWWNSWWRHGKKGSYYEHCDRREVERNRQHVRELVREGKRLTNRYERREGQRELRNEIEDLD